MAGFAVSVIRVVLWIGLDAVMHGVTEMERNMGASRQIVKENSISPKTINFIFNLRARL